MSDSFVDLLLVRLGREEEKKKVLKLLITNLDLSVVEAENAVANSPAVIKEAVPMNEARIIQKDLYPYIDLLPRLEDGLDVNDETDAEDAEEEEEVKEVKEEKEETPEVDTSHTRTEDRPLDDYIITQPSLVDNTDYEPIETTSASEEIISTTRCHICGRTPTNGERLAPCRTCSQLTCRNCFDRIAHVCNHCAKDGKAIDRANEGMGTQVEKGLEFDTEEPVKETSGRSSNYLRIAAAVIFVFAIAALFYFMDPMNLFPDGQYSSVAEIEVINTDTTQQVVEDSTGVIEIAIDTTAAPADTLNADDPFGLQSIALPDGCIPDENPSPINYQRSVPREVYAEIPAEESEIIFGQLELIASSIPVVLDDGVFLVYHDTTSVLVVALLHPVETEVRIQLMREIAAWLIPTQIDQLVLIYRENRYQEAILFSLVQEAFPDVEGIFSPRQFQGILGYREDCWESITGPVTQWFSTIE
ncbi:MAG: hypothetical protein KAR40_05180 [Candidatus Sabulitectum sp.]|nr:hypothetical protein [Candidatus Sabulitectum sp.]